MAWVSLEDVRGPCFSLNDTNKPCAVGKSIPSHGSYGNHYFGKGFIIFEPQPY